ncbi:progesterone-induced-blocking factor 1-like [Gigantopelta aegis]|uniref:progesterone-induced-blocking factor 1-like n=1 Tax=Gigantopelta aegis TaxID=1735272 RepID=UPI001B887C9E|nr:progesterone-induced-blocking factor 1-like [Gigantopelta aegis]
MAGRDISKTFEEFESDELSLETSVPTDLTLSPDHSDGEGRGTRKKRITKQLIERKQLVHDIQLLKIELSQKNLQIENLKAEYLQRTEELEEKLNDALHQKQILTARLESQLQLQESEAKKRQDLIRQELEEVRRRQQQLDSVNERLQEKAGNVRRSLKDLSLSEEKYYELRTLSEEDLSLRDYVALRLFEVVKPLQTEIDQLRMRNRTLEDETKINRNEILDLQKHLDEERQDHGELRVRYQKMAEHFSEIKDRVQHDNFRVENYDRIKGERDHLESDHLDVHRQLSVLEASHSVLQKERDDLSRELTAAKQSIALLKQDKDYLAKQVADYSNRASFSEEKVQQLNRQVDDAKAAREEMYEKYIYARDQYKNEYEDKLREELEQIRIRTNTEIDRLRSSTKEMYERENRNLREARNMAVSEKEKIQCSERELKTQYEQLLTEFRKLQTNGDNRVSELMNDLKIKSFEVERTQMVHEETVRNQQEAQMDIEKLQKKTEVLMKEYHTLELSMEKRVAELENTLSEQKVKLETYERLEQELDDVVMQAAEVEDEQDAERVLFSYGYGANVPSTAKRRLQQSVHLARRVLSLEKANTSMRHEIEREKQKTQQLAEELRNSNSLLDQAEQPYNYLIESIRLRDSQMQKQKELIATMEADLRKLEKERGDLIRTKNQMSLDLERLLNQKEEMAVLKQVVLSLSTRQHSDGKVHSKEPTKPKSASTKLRPTFEPFGEPNVEQPGSISLTKHPASSKWAKSLQQKNSTGNTKYSKVYGTASS